MRGLILRGQDAPAPADLPERPIESCQDAARLLERLDETPEAFQWVGLAAEAPDAMTLAATIRERHPELPVVWLPADPEAPLPFDAAGRDDPRATEKLATLVALTDGIAHDIGTPMTAILGYAELLSRSVDDEKNQRRAATIVEQVHRVRDLVETLLTFSRVRERPFVLLDLGDVVDKALEMHRGRFEAQGIRIDRHRGGAAMTAGDPGQLHGVLSVLLLRALEAMPAGGTLRLEVRDGAEGGAELLLGDTGPPIDETLRPHLFDVGPPSAPQAAGAGRGLLVARSVLRDHRGDIELVGDTARGEGLGCEFCVRLPQPEPA